MSRHLRGRLGVSFTNDGTAPAVFVLVGASSNGVRTVVEKNTYRRVARQSLIHAARLSFAKWYFDLSTGKAPTRLVRSTRSYS